MSERGDMSEGIKTEFVVTPKAMGIVNDLAEKWGINPDEVVQRLIENWWQTAISSQVLSDKNYAWRADDVSFHEFCKLGPQLRVKRSDLYDAYATFPSPHFLGKKKFFELVRLMPGVGQVQVNGDVHFTGIGLIE